MIGLTELLRRRPWTPVASRITDAPPRVRRLAVGGAFLLLLLLLGAVGYLAMGLPPALPVAVAVLAVLAVRPFAGLVYAMVVLAAPLGLWLAGVRAAVGWAFGGRAYALTLSAVAVVFALLVTTVIRTTVLRGRRLTRRELVTGAAAALVVAAWSLVGFAHHGVAQTLVGVRIVLFPVAVLVVIAAMPLRDVRRLVTVLSWLVVANALAAAAEVVVGPARLAAWGFDRDRTIRYIDGTFRAPGLTEFNASLGMLAGAYLLGYLALWLTGAARPQQRPQQRQWSWHAGAVAAAVCLALSTSRSGALLLAGGLVVAVVLNRSGGAAGRRRSRLLGLAVVVCVAVGFVAVGATGVHSVFQRFDVWSSLLRAHVPPYGLGIGAVGAATNSRVAAGPQLFVDNYYVSVALQFGPLALAVLVAAMGYALVRLWRRSVDRPTYVLYLAVVAGLAGAFLVIEAWEYAAAMMCLAVFVAHAWRFDHDNTGAG